MVNPDPRRDHAAAVSPLRRIRLALLRWVDADAGAVLDEAPDLSRRIDWLRTLPFAGLHLAVIAVIWTGVSPFAVAVAVGLYVLRMFAITGFYHRYFSHRAFKTSRPVQFVFAVIAAAAVQRGPLWWASQHRHHHAHADDDEDVHSPRRHGFLWSHLGWFLSRMNFRTRAAYVKDWARFPELCFLDRFDVVVPIVLAVSLYFAGEGLAAWMPEIGTDGLQLLVWGFVVSTVVLYHATFTVNSLAHVWGSRRFNTRDDSRNNPWLAVLTLGEGWHNNHHHYPGAARQGFFWWEVDPTFWCLKLLERLGLIWDLKPVPPAMLEWRRNESGPGAAA